jgi:hypothetical protein
MAGVGSSDWVPGMEELLWWFFLTSGWAGKRYTILTESNLRYR